MRQRFEWIARGGLAAALAFIAAAAAPGTAAAQQQNECWAFPELESGLAVVGPLRATADQFPVWYEDVNGVRLELCLDPLDPRCAIPADHIPDPFAPVDMDTGNFPEEAFYWMGDAEMTTTSGTAQLIMALEAAWAAEVVRPGDAVVFGRVRHRIDLNEPGRYRITHPYGVDEYVVTAELGRRAINHTEDIGVAAMNFAEVMKSRIGPFLVNDDPRFPPPPGFIGDAATPVRVKGARTGNNFYRVESLVWDPNQNQYVRGGAVLHPGGQGLQCSDAHSPHCVETDLFTLMGKVATSAGVDVDRATYTRTSEGTTKVSVFASSAPGQNLVVSLDGGQAVPMTPAGPNSSRYYALLDGSMSSAPVEVTVTNLAGGQNSSKDAFVTDELTASATFDAGLSRLTVQASSTDKSSAAQLTVVGFGAMTTSPQSFTVQAPPPNVTVRSCFGGEVTVPVALVRTVEPPAIEATASAASVPSGTVVTLTGEVSTGGDLTVDWRQTSGPAVALHESGSVATFVAPPQAGTMTFEFVVTGSWGTTTRSVSVDVTNPAIDAVLAPMPTTVVRGAVVTLDGSPSAGDIASYSWSASLVGSGNQSPAVAFELHGENTATPWFVFPLDTDVTAVVLTLTVTGTYGGTDTASITVVPMIDALTLTTATFRASRNEWRIEGTATVTTANEITIAADDVVIGTAAVNPDGSWVFRVRNAALTANASTTLDITSRAGGSLENQPITLN